MACVQVYGIIAFQLACTTIVAATVVFNHSVQQFVAHSFGLNIALLLCTILLLIPLYIYRQTHPTNLVLLGVWTCMMSGGQAGRGPGQYLKGLCVLHLSSCGCHCTWTLCGLLGSLV